MKAQRFIRNNKIIHTQYAASERVYLSLPLFRSNVFVHTQDVCVKQKNTKYIYFVFFPSSHLTTSVHVLINFHIT